MTIKHRTSKAYERFADSLGGEVRERCGKERARLRQVQRAFIAGRASDAQMAAAESRWNVFVEAVES